MTRAPEPIVVGDEAFTPEEWAAEQERRERKRAYQRAYVRRPEVRERKRLYMRAWCARNRDRYNAWKREYMRAWRARSEA